MSVKYSSSSVGSSKIHPITPLSLPNSNFTSVNNTPINTPSTRVNSGNRNNRGSFSQATNNDDENIVSELSTKYLDTPTIRRQKQINGNINSNNTNVNTTSGTNVNASLAMQRQLTHNNQISRPNSLNATNMRGFMNSAGGGSTPTSTNGKVPLGRSYSFSHSKVFTADNDETNDFSVNRPHSSSAVSGSGSKGSEILSFDPMMIMQNSAANHANSDNISVGSTNSNATITFNGGSMAPPRSSLKRNSSSKNLNNAGSTSNSSAGNLKESSGSIPANGGIPMLSRSKSFKKFSKSSRRNLIKRVTFREPLVDEDLHAHEYFSYQDHHDEEEDDDDYDDSDEESGQSRKRKRKRKREKHGIVLSSLFACFSIIMTVVTIPLLTTVLVCTSLSTRKSQKTYKSLKKQQQLQQQLQEEMHFSARLAHRMRMFSRRVFGGSSQRMYHSDDPEATSSAAVNTEQSTEKAKRPLIKLLQSHPHHQQNSNTGVSTTNTANVGITRGTSSSVLRSTFLSSLSSVSLISEGNELEDESMTIDRSYSLHQMQIHDQKPRQACVIS